MVFDSLSSWALGLLERSLYITEIVFSVVSLLCLVGCVVVLIILSKRQAEEAETHLREDRFSRQRVMRELRHPPRHQEDEQNMENNVSQGHHGARFGGRSSERSHIHRPRFVLPAIDEDFGDALREYYAALSVLGLKPRASHDEIKSSYRTLVKRYHPDVLSDEGDPLRTEKLQVATHAYHRLLELEGDLDFQTKLSLLHREGEV